MKDNYLQLPDPDIPVTHWVTTIDMILQHNRAIAMCRIFGLTDIGCIAF
jgi:hypothetical protein